jgi:hypothetical protein
VIGHRVIGAIRAASDLTAIDVEVIVVTALAILFGAVRLRDRERGMAWLSFGFALMAHWYFNGDRLVIIGSTMSAALLRHWTAVGHGQPGALAHEKLQQGDADLARCTPPAIAEQGQASTKLVSTLLEPSRVDEAALKQERINLGVAPRIRLVAFDVAQGVEHAGQASRRHETSA